MSVLDSGPSSGPKRTTLSRPTSNRAARTEAERTTAQTDATPTAPMPRGSATDARPSKHRADLQGLRAVASLLVATYHTWIGTVSGGVDIFFVVTGMLITTTLLGNVERYGRVRLPSYLLRLAGRLFPLAGVVLTTIAIAAVVFWPPSTWATTFHELFAAATYWENWLLGQQATDYLAHDTAKSPVQHFWAMSVQGQFYLIWAAVFALVAALVSKFDRLRLRPTATVVVTVIALASAAWAIHGITTNAVFVYYDTFARLWEFGIGAAVALIVGTRVLPRVARSSLGVIGLGLILSAGFLPATWSYPGPVALWPALGAAAILLSHQPAASDPGPVTRLLSWKPLAWLGGYSYGIYLWSWPCLVAYQTIFPDVERVGVVAGLTVLGVAIVLAIVSIRLLRVFDRWRTGRLPAASRRRHVSILAGLVPLVAIVGLIVPPVQSTVSAQDTDVDIRYSSVSQLQRSIKQALAATALPADLRPGLGHDARVKEWTVDGCATVDETNMESCRYFDGPDPQGEIFVIGDSQAVSWMPGLREAIAGRASIQLLTREMCPMSVADVSAEWQGSDAGDVCREHNAWALDQIRERRPLLVVMSFGAWFGDAVAGATDPYDGAQRLAEGTRPYLAELEALGQRTVWLDSSPSGGDWQQCSAARTPEQYTEMCNTPVLYDGLVRVAGFEAAASDFGIPFVSTLDWFCDRNTLVCPSFVDSVAVQADASHLSWGMSQALAPLIARSIGLDDLWAA